MRISILGAGIIGLSAAWRLSEDGHVVTVYDGSPQRAATHAAAGMLAAVTEAEFGEEDLVPFAVESVSQWPDFARRLEAVSDIELSYRAHPTILLGWNESDRAAVRRQVTLYQRLRLPVETIGVRRLRRTEPLLSSSCREAHLVTTDQAVDPRAVLRALWVACEGTGVEFVPQDVHDIRRLDADRVVLATGNQARAFDLPIRPVRGVVLRLKGTTDLPGHTVRSIVDDNSVYLVPRLNGELVVGATSDEITDPGHGTAGATLDLLRYAAALVPEVREYRLEEVTVGYRPTGPDNRPLLGYVDETTIVAAGHYRHGIALAPATATSVSELVASGSSSLAPSSFDPLRWGAWNPNFPVTPDDRFVTGRWATRL
ncbi:glycine oxidase ThiO [Haloglycomyces albus]|uniref:glycine oxidase ThiO n=1 Tax=Haloglycomyces albus TaxID=526067 RepID=UPI00046CE147|nr:glycine oxidase ThiO [Haloglycomyces albus]